ncbi:MAG: glycosyltransferase family 4 protein, partial [Bacteroidota bacterium]
MKKVLYIKHADSSFVLSDQHILEKRFRVVPFLINRKGTGWHFIGQMMRLSLFIIGNAGGSCALITWFGDYHSAVMVVMGKIFRKKTIIFAGGQEAICYPELRKGVYYKKGRGILVKFALRHATLIIPNHHSLIFHQNFYYSPGGKKDGISHYVPGIRTPMPVIPNGISTDKFYRDPAIIKDPLQVLTAGTMGSVADFLNKGFDLFTEMARRNADLRFTLIGIKKEFMPWIEENFGITKVPNLILVFSYCPDKVLFEQYNKAKVFVQASITEGMPNTLNEAMLCSCIPVGSNINGIPDVIGDTGIVVMKRDVSELEAAVRKALARDSGNEARSRILAQFTLELREKQVLK